MNTEKIRNLPDKNSTLRKQDTLIKRLSELQRRNIRLSLKQFAERL